MIVLPDEKDDEIPSGICLAESCVDVLGRPIATFNIAKLGRAVKNFHNFRRFNAMLATQLLDDFVEPDETSYLQPEHSAGFYRFRRALAVPSAESPLR